MCIPRTAPGSSSRRRQGDAEGGAGPGPGGDVDGAVVLGDEAAADAEADAGAGVALGGEEGLPDARQVLGGDAVAVVLDLEDHPVAGPGDAGADAAAVGGGLQGV